MTREDKKTLVEIGLAGALGAGIGGVLAISFSQWWFLGALAGSLLAGIACKPKEVGVAIILASREAYTAMRVRTTAPQVREMCSALASLLFSRLKSAKSNIAVRLANFRRRLPEAFRKTVCTFAVIAYIALYIAAAGFYASLLLPVNQGMTDLIGTYFVGCVSGIVTAVFCCGMLFGVMELSTLPKKDRRWPMWTFVLSHIVGLILIRIDSTPDKLDKVLESDDLEHVTWRHKDGSLVRLDGAICLGLLILLVSVLWPITVIGLLLLITLFMVDFLLTLALALATNERMAAMIGALTGGVLTYFTHSEIYSLPAPVCVVAGMIVGGLVGPTLYFLRVSAEQYFAPTRTTSR